MPLPVPRQCEALSITGGQNQFDETADRSYSSLAAARAAGMYASGVQDPPDVDVGVVVDVEDEVWEARHWPRSGMPSS